MNRISATAKRASVGASWALSLMIVAGAAQSAYAQAPAASGVPKVEDLFKNIKVLNGYPADQLRPTMMYFRASLGVTCEACHPGERELDIRKITLTGGQGQPGWWYQDPTRELDTFPAKNMARMMVQMVFKINKENFGGRQVVTCFTCHRGNRKPFGVANYSASAASIPVVNDAVTVTATKEPVGNITADQVLDKFIAALGGESAIKKISTRVAKGQVFSAELFAQNAQGERSHELEIYSKAPGMRYMTHQLGNGEARSFNGDSGWHQGRTSTDVRHQPRFMRGDELDNEKLEDPFFFALQLRNFVTGTKVTRVDKLSGKDAYVLSGRTQTLPLVELYFDKESGLLLRSVAETQAIVGRFATTDTFSDFREVDGVKMPFFWTNQQVGERVIYTYKINDVTQNVPVDDAKFVKPDKYRLLFGKEPAIGVPGR